MNAKWCPIPSWSRWETRSISAALRIVWGAIAWRWQGIALSLALSLFAPPATLATEGGNSVPESPHTTLSTAELSVLESRIKELRELQTSIDSVRTNLISMAEKAQNDADAAPNLTERRRYEQLYTEVSSRLGELDNNRADLIRLLGELENRLEILRRGQ